MLRRASFLTLVLAAVVALPGLADTLKLKNGQSVDGTFLGGDTRTIRFLDSSGDVQNFSVGDVASISFVSEAATAAAPAPAPQPAPAASSTQAGRASSGMTIPAGSVITVRMIDSIDSDITGAGERFRASIDDPVVVNDQVVIPRGADATVQIVRVEQSGAIKGSDEISLKLHDITVDGKPYELATNYAEVKSSGKGKSTAKTTAVTTGIGAALGGIFGGGKGAAVGAGAGAATGVAVSAARGKHLRIPSETRLDFVLRAPLPM